MLIPMWHCTVLQNPMIPTTGSLLIVSCHKDIIIRKDFRNEKLHAVSAFEMLHAILSFDSCMHAGPISEYEDR